ncbi:hypothetical protein [Candidatus Bathycorpusculum sp.]|uniref:hypothetical protein n=1 Tax=Candidatus Bathycorpusculum sp. TaxID=2994959 RepID=UPI00281DE3B5|nr:hypothetical protein [Candidatus Termitimicrobium sp.]
MINLRMQQPTLTGPSFADAFITHNNLSAAPLTNHKRTPPQPHTINPPSTHKKIQTPPNSLATTAKYGHSTT